jgi:hypothetical protein
VKRSMIDVDFWWLFGAKKWSHDHYHIEYYPIYRIFAPYWAIPMPKWGFPIRPFPRDLSLNIYNNSGCSRCKYVQIEISSPFELWSHVFVTINLIVWWSDLFTSIVYFQNGVCVI